MIILHGVSCYLFILFWTHPVQPLKAKIQFKLRNTIYLVKNIPFVIAESSAGYILLNNKIIYKGL